MPAGSSRTPACSGVTPLVLPFVALRSTFPGLRGVRTTQREVSFLVEVLADDAAPPRHAPDVLASALYTT